MRRGVTILEALVFFTLSLILVGYCYDLFISGIRVGDSTHRGLNLQAGVRSFMENLTKDVNGAVYIGEPHALTPKPATKIVVWVFNDDLENPDGGMVLPGNRLAYNDGPDARSSLGVNPWPFAHTENPTRWHLPVVQVTYEWNAQTQKVTRTAVPGDLMREAPRGEVFVTKYTFQPLPTAGAPQVKVVSEQVTEFEVTPFGYDETQKDPTTGTGRLKPTLELPDVVSGMPGGSAAGGLVIPGFGGGAAPGGGAAAGRSERIGRTAMLLVKVKATFDFKDRRQDPEVHIATKIWSYARLSDHRFFPWFSSIDDDMRF